MSHRFAGNVGVSIRHHRRCVTLTAFALRRSLRGQPLRDDGRGVGLGTAFLPRRARRALSTWTEGGPARFTPMCGRNESPAVVMPIEAFNRGASRVFADHRTSVGTMPINRGRRSGQAPGLAPRNRSASYIRARQRPLHAISHHPTLVRDGAWPMLPIRPLLPVSPSRRSWDWLALA